MSGSGAGDVTVFSDAFTRANEAPISTNGWTDAPGAWDPGMALNTNTFRCNATGVNNYAVNSAVLTANQYAQCKIIARADNNHVVGVFTRMASTSDADSYVLFQTFGTANYEINRLDDTGSIAGNTLVAGGTAAVNDLMELRSIGTLHAAVQNGTYILTALDATYTSLLSGIHAYANAATTSAIGDDFEAGTITPTRFYFPSSGSPIITPSAFDAGWGDTEDAVVLPLSSSRTNTSAADTVIDEASVTNPLNVLGVQYVYPLPLTPAQTIKGVVRGIIRCHESSASANMVAQWTWKIWKDDGTTAATLTSLYTGALAEEPSTTTINRRFPVAFTQANVIATPYTVPADGSRYYIGVELGCRAIQADATNFTWTMALGDPTAGSDCTEDITGTTGVAWAEFDSTIAFGFNSRPMFRGS